MPKRRFKRKAKKRKSTPSRARAPSATPASFDRKFGPEFLAQAPASPGVYRVFGASGDLIYVGKAKNLRRRLSQYRNAKRTKKHHKMRSIVGDAGRIEFQVCADHIDACLTETRLIRDHRPKWNVAGAFFFLYPMIGVRAEDGYTYFCYTTGPEQFDGQYEFHGAFRSREWTGEAFFSLMKLLAYIGHPLTRFQLAKRRGFVRGDRYSYQFGFRRLPERWVELLAKFWRGESTEATEELVLALIENAGARRAKFSIQDHLNHLKRFWKHEAQPLSRARAKTGVAIYPVPQRERDLVFLRYRMG